MSRVTPESRPNARSKSARAGAKRLVARAEDLARLEERYSTPRVPSRAVRAATQQPLTIEATKTEESRIVG
jgi:hypothetical protein